MKSKSIYDSGIGDELANEQLYSPIIRRHIQAERRLLTSLVPHVGRLWEIGCMWGRFLEQAASAKIDYVGIDPVARYIAHAKQRITALQLNRERYRVTRSSAACLSKCFSRLARPAKKRWDLLWFPFNSFGNMESPEIVISQLAQLQMPFAISSYRTSHGASRQRLQYYENCGHSEIVSHCDRQGVSFRSKEGLSSIAYHQRYFIHLCAAAGIQSVRAISFNPIGVLFCSADVAEIIQ